MPSEQHRLVETVRKEYSMRQICQTLSFNKSTFYYQPKSDTSEDVLRVSEIQRLATAYPTYGYRRITKLLATEGHTVGYKRVETLLMKEENLSVILCMLGDGVVMKGSQKLVERAMV